MQQNVEEAHAKASETERKLCRKLGDSVYSWEQELVRPHHIMDKMWQMMQSNDTKTMNTNKDFEELLSKAQHMDLDRRTKKQQDSGRNKKKTTTRTRDDLRSKPADTHIYLCERLAVQGHPERY